MSKKKSSRYYWQSARILLNYKKLIAITVPCVLIQSAFFSVTIPVMVLIFKAFFVDDPSLSVRALCQKYIVGSGTGGQMRLDFYQWLMKTLPEGITKYGLFLSLMGIVAVVAIIGATCNFIHQAIIIRVAQHSTMRWRDMLYKKYMCASMEHMTLRGTSDYLSRLLNDTMALARGHNAILGKGVIEISKGLVSFLLALWINYQITLLALIAIVPVTITLSYFGKIIRRASKESSETHGQILSQLNQTLGGLQVVKIHNAEGYERRSFRQYNRKLYRLLYRMRLARALSSPLVELLAVFTMIGILSFVAKGLIEQSGAGGGMSHGEQYIMVLGLLAAAGGSLKPLSSMKLHIREADATAQRVLQAMDIPTEPTSYAERSAFPVLDRHHQNIIFQNLSYRYPDADQAAVNAVNLEVGFGQSVAIVGSNGSGKTTLLSMLSRLLEPAGGCILIDGQDIGACNLKSLRSQMSIVSQHTVLFDRSIAENIAYGNSQATREAIIAAGKAAFADEFICTLPRGYDTVLGENGSGLSGGQKQRISIARAILRNPAIMILDEATSQIDADSEVKISQALHDLKQGRTTFIIAHRLSTVVDCDVIVVMDQGKIIDQGTHQTLMARNKIYQSLTASQMISG